MSFTGITVEGGLLPLDRLEQIAARPDEVPGQRPQDFGLPAGTRLSEAIQHNFSVAQSLYAKFAHRRAAVGESTTSATRESWILPLLQSVLDFDDITFQRASLTAGGRAYPISHLAMEGAVPLHIVGYGRDIDRRGDDRTSPYALVQEYLNRTDALWGLVTDGRRLRLLRDTTRVTKPTYIEIDLEGIIGGGLYAEFVVLWRLLHATRFPKEIGQSPPCLLEQWYDDGVVAGGKVRERLSVGVKAALEHLGQGFVAHPGNTKLREAVETGALSPLELYRQLLRLVYRVLFLMVAEERRLLRLADSANVARQPLYDAWYSVARLRDRAERPRGADRYGDLWKCLVATFYLFRETERADALGLGVLNGEFFGPDACPHLEAAEITNDVLLAAIYELSTFEELTRRRTQGRRRIAYAALDVEELGSVYEGLLDFRPTVDTEARTFALVPGNERKESGSYYTPSSLVAELIKSALEPVLAERLAEAPTAADKERAILAIRVLDPAAGSGHFLLAAARRLGRELASVRSGEAEPTPLDYRAAVRDVVRHCLYAVDKSPLAVDLCKVALWLESQTPGVPLSFLDHRVRCGDSLIGVFDLTAVTEGIPDDAFKVLTGDDRAVAAAARADNRRDRKKVARQDAAGALATFELAQLQIDAMDEPNPAAIEAKSQRFKAMREEPLWRRWKLACDLWCAAFFQPKTEAGKKLIPTSTALWQAFTEQRAVHSHLEAHSTTLADGRFFHWPLEFPDVMAKGGFDVVMGNPPWERIKLQEQEFFGDRDRDIAEAPNKATRKKLIDALESAPAGSAKRALWDAFVVARRTAEAERLFVGESGRFILTAVGDVNTYALFAEVFASLVSDSGRVGTIIPSAIATDHTTRKFFDSLMQQKRLLSLWEFENEGFFAAGHGHMLRFALTTISGTATENPADFFFQGKNINELIDKHRHFKLTLDDIVLLNPNTRTCPIFRTERDARLTKTVYRRVPVLIDNSKSEVANPWGIRFMAMFHMSGDSGLFQTYDQLRDVGGSIAEMAWSLPDGSRLLPLYEAKMAHHWNHRHADYSSLNYGERAHKLPAMPQVLLADPNYRSQPCYWVDKDKIDARLRGKDWQRDWLIGWRDVTDARASARTVIASLVPRVAVGDKFLLMLPSAQPHEAAALLANLNCLVLDFVARQKVGGNSLKNFTMKQLPILPPKYYIPADLQFIATRALELTYTAWDLQPFANDLGFDGPPFAWDPDRRALLRAELDAYYAYLYGLSRDELRYVLDPKEVMGADFPSETFRVLKDNESRKYGEYRTRRLVLEAWDRFVEDGTFDPARLADPAAMGKAQAALLAARTKLTDLERRFAGLIEKADEAKRPVLFVEGVSDVPMLEAAWATFFPREKLPVRVLPAGGTLQMRSLAGEGKALRELLGDRLVLALADNDGAGRALWNNGHFKKGGTFREHPNGLRWALLQPSPDFAATMRRYGIPEPNWPFTVEQAIPAALRREALAAGAYGFANEPPADLFTDPTLARRLSPLLAKLDPADDACFHLRAPAPALKERFAAWITSLERGTPDTFAALKPICDGIAALARAPEVV